MTRDWHFCPANRRGREADVHPWVDGYVSRRDDLPAANDPDGDRIADWTSYLTRQTAERPWRDVLALWWPRLRPRATRVRTRSPSWRTVWRSGRRARYVPGVEAPAGSVGVREAFQRLPRIGSQEGDVAGRFAQLADLVDAATVGYLRYGHTSPVILVHTATAPNAVLHTLPALPRELWADSLTAAWAACAASTVTFAPGRSAPRAELRPSGPAIPLWIVQRNGRPGAADRVRGVRAAIGGLVARKLGPLPLRTLLRNESRVVHIVQQGRSTELTNGLGSAQP